MIDPEVSAAFPPYFISETGESFFGWVWTAPAGDDLAAQMHLGEQGGLLGSLSLNPTPNGSCLVPTDEGLMVRLTEADKANLKGREVMFGLWVTSDGETAERFGQLIISDWASEPHGGNA